MANPPDNPFAGMFNDAPPVPAQLDPDKVLEINKSAERQEELRLEREKIRKGIIGHGVALGARRPRDLLKKPVPEPFQLDEVPPPLLSWPTHFRRHQGLTTVA